MTDPLDIRRVVVALDTAERTLTVVREGVRVARSLGTELEGLFVEDEELLRHAGHAFARGFEAGGEERELSTEALEREWRVVAASMQAALEREAERRHVASRFAVARGIVADALDERLSSGDVVLLGWGGWAPAANRTAPVRVLYPGGPASDRALDAAARLAGPKGRLAVFIVPDGEVLERVAEHIREKVEQRVGELRLLALPDPSPATVRRAVEEAPGGLLLVPQDLSLVRPLVARSRCARFPCTVLVVR